MLLTPDFADSRIIATLSTIAFSTAMAFNFAMRRRRAVVAILLLYLPGLIALGIHPEPQRAELVTLAFYLSYLVLALSRSHREYLGTVELELQLLEQRQRLDALSRTDGLTQLGNRYQFNNLFPAMVATASRQGSPLSLVLLDIDFFKRINDEHGHAMGDQCLQQFAERMRGCSAATAMRCCAWGRGIRCVDARHRAEAGVQAGRGFPPRPGGQGPGAQGRALAAHRQPRRRLLRRAARRRCRSLLQARRRRAVPPGKGRDRLETA